MGDHEHHRDHARVARAAAAAARDCPDGRSVRPVDRSNVVVARASVNDDGIHRAAVRCRACQGRAFDVLGVPADVLAPTGPRFASLWIARRCLCDRTSVGRVAARPGHPPPLGLAGSWRCARGHFLAAVDPALGRVRLPCRKCRLELYAIVADVIEAARVDGLVRAS